ncbi:hypothetical protein T03_10291 [Trichinella britovi]|uniref:Uncharacterized protein n=1 Tax=Trichinella britovi TaxID=45882 RepID=A0A0V1CQ83_TRIBR|nr:hypothetical protein T03_10291 [Trichinella britovi]
MGSWVRLPASSTRCPLSLASVSGVSTCFAAQNSLYTQGANACKIVRLFSADIAIVSSSNSFVADQTQGLTSNDSQTAANDDTWIDHSYDNRRLYDFALGSGTQIASFHILPSISGHRNFCLAVTTKADKADGEMGVHHFYHLSHWNCCPGEYSSSDLERRLRRFTFLHRSQDTGTSAWLSLLKLIKLTGKWAFTTFITFRIGITVQESIPRALNIRLVIYGNRRLYDFASGSGTQIASFHILASISGCTLRRILHISRCGANLPI